MKLLLDQDVYAITIRFLRDSGHDVVTASDLGRSRANDSELLTIAHQEQRIFVTRDRDFGGLVFLQGMGAGVIYLRLLLSTIHSVHRELETVLSSHSEDELRNIYSCRTGKAQIPKATGIGNRCWLQNE